MNDKNAALFAGQGAQAVGMARDLAEARPACRALFDRADAILGWSLSEAVFEGPVERLTRTDVCQPAIFVASAAAWTAFRELAPAVPFAPPMKRKPRAHARERTAPQRIMVYCPLNYGRHHH